MEAVRIPPRALSLEPRVAPDLPRARTRFPFGRRHVRRWRLSGYFFLGCEKIRHLFFGRRSVEKEGETKEQRPLVQE